MSSVDKVGIADNFNGLLELVTMNAETAYLFRHALLRDTAYQLQLPSDRAKLHAIALRVIEDALGGAPEPLTTDANREVRLAPHALDSAAEELAQHAKLGAKAPGVDRSALEMSEVCYLLRAAEWANSRCHHSRALQLFDALALHPAASEPVRVRALRQAGWLQYALGQSERGKQVLEQCVALAKEHGVSVQAAKAKGELAFVLSELGQFKEAETLAHEALSTARQNRARTDEAHTLTFLATIASRSGKRLDAERLYHEALEIFRAESFLRGQGFALANLATTIDRDGREAEAESVYRQSLEILRTIGNRRIEAIVLGNLASLLDKNGDLGAAEMLYSQALAIHREIGNVRSEGFALGNVASVYEKTGRLEQARLAFEQALAIHARLQAKWSLAVHRCDFALFKLRRGLTAEAAELWRQGAAALKEIGDTDEFKDKNDAMLKACSQAGVAPFDASNPIGT